MTCASACLLAAATVATWNGKWFPSGRAEHRASPEVEAAAVREAGAMIRRGLDAADPQGTNDVILCLNEIRGPRAAKALCEAVGRTNLQVAVVTAYRRRDRFDMQQDAIATTLPVASASWSRWKNEKALTPPRGYAMARLLLSPSVTAAVYAVHLKSNYGQKTDAEADANRSKRSLAIMQILELERSARGAAARPTIVAGDFNADRWPKSGAPEALFGALDEAGFANPLEEVPAEARVTYPGRGKWRNQTLDYVMCRGMRTLRAPFTVSAASLSDHDALFVVLDADEAPPPPQERAKRKRRKKPRPGEAGGE